MKLCGKGEQTPVQLKERVVDNYEVGKEMVCYANERSGRTIIIGVNDKTGEINALSRLEVQEQTGLLSQIAEQNVKPAISIKTENVDVPGGQLIVATIPEGINKPYKDNKGIIVSIAEAARPSSAIPTWKSATTLPSAILLSGRKPTKLTRI